MPRQVLTVEAIINNNKTSILLKFRFQIHNTILPLSIQALTHLPWLQSSTIEYWTAFISCLLRIAQKYWSFFTCFFLHIQNFVWFAISILAATCNLRNNVRKSLCAHLRCMRCFMKVMISPIWWLLILFLVLKCMFVTLQVEYNGERTVAGVSKFLQTDGVYGQAAPDHDEL